MGRWDCTDAMAAATGIWNRVDELVGRAPSVEALRAHGVHLLAARAWRSKGRPIPRTVREDERRAAMLAMAAPPLLERVRAAYGGRLALMKGPEVAARYPDPGVRRFRDLDLLADEPDAAQRALLAAGFVRLGSEAEYNGLQHLCPLAWPGLPLIVEVHREPNRPPWLRAPPGRELLNTALPSATGVEGLLAPAPAAHALLLAGHAWAHHPLGRLIDLIDVAATLSRGERGERGERRLAGELATDWGWDGLWRATLAVVDRLFAGERRPLSLTVWARHLEPVRGRSVLENHFARLAAAACALPPRSAPIAVGATVVRTATRRGDERWRDKLHRCRLAIGHAFMDKSEHERTLTRDPRRS